MKINLTKNKYLFLFLAAIGPATSLAQPVTETAPASDWSFAVSPYLWIAGVKVDTRLDQIPPTTPPETTRFETKITGGALLQARVQYRAVGLMTDLVWLRVNSESRSPGPAFSTLDLESNFFHSTVAITYTLPTSGGLHLQLLAGVRSWNVNEDMTATAGILPGFTVSGDETWHSPAFGAFVRYDLDQKWSLVSQGFVNAFADDSDGWELMGGVTYRFTPSWSGTLGYRFLREEYSREPFNFTTDIQGFILGVTYGF